MAPSRVVLVAGRALALAACLMATSVEAQGRYVGQSPLPTAKFTAANPAPAGAPRWACKTDCVVKLDNVAQVRQPEPDAPLAAVVPGTRRHVPSNLTKRTRPAVEDAVFESLDKSDRAKHYKYKRADGTKPVQ